MSGHEKAPVAATTEALDNVETIEESNVMTNNSTASSNIIPFDFRGHSVRAVIVDGEPWFVASDVCRILSIANTSQAVQALDDDERSMFNIGRQGLANTVNESGLYTLILRSREAVNKGSKPHAFRKWVTSEALPAIRKHGRYEDGAGKMTDLVNSVIGATELVALKGVIADKAKLLPKERQLSFKHTMHHRLHTRFNVPRTELIPHESFADACNFVAAYALEGEWLGKAPEADMNEGDWGNLNALVVHMQAVSKYWHDYKLYDHFSKVGSPVGAKIIDHVNDGFCAASALKRKHGDKMEAAEKAIREMYQRILSEQAGRIAA